MLVGLGEWTTLTGRTYDASTIEAYLAADTQVIDLVRVTDGHPSRGGFGFIVQETSTDDMQIGFGMVVGRNADGSVSVLETYHP